MIRSISLILSSLGSLSIDMPDASDTALDSGGNLGIVDPADFGCGMSPIPDMPVKVIESIRCNPRSKLITIYIPEGGLD